MSGVFNHHPFITVTFVICAEFERKKERSSNLRQRRCASWECDRCIRTGTCRRLRWHSRSISPAHCLRTPSSYCPCPAAGLACPERYDPAAVTTWLWRRLVDTLTNSWDARPCPVSRPSARTLQSINDFDLIKCFRHLIIQYNLYL